MAFLFLLSIACSFARNMGLQLKLLPQLVKSLQSMSPPFAEFVDVQLLLFSRQSLNLHLRNQHQCLSNQLLSQKLQSLQPFSQPNLESLLRSN